MGRRLRLLALAGVGALAMGALAPDESSDAAGAAHARATAAEDDAALVRAARGAVRDALRDPGSAAFSDERVAARSPLPVVCGRVNARNGFGGYAGRRAYVTALLPGTTAVDDGSAAFARAWDRLCLGRGGA